MPLYEYQCDACGHRFEVIQKFSDPPRETCEKCGGRVSKLLSSPAIQFKGSGWYITDYARAGKSEGNSGKSEGGSGEGKAETAASDAKKGDTKTESKSDSPSSDTKSDSKDSKGGKPPAPPAPSAASS